MADNIAIFDKDGNVQVIATDDIGSVHYQRAKSTWGGDDTVIETDRTNPFPVQLTANALAEGSVPFRDIAVTNAAVAIKASTGILFQLHAFNPDGSDTAYLHIYNSASVTVGTTTPVLTFPILPQKSIPWQSSVGSKFLAAIRCAATLGLTGSAAPTTPLILNAEYK